MLRVLSGVARGSHSGSTQGQARMAAPGGVPPGGGVLAVAAGQYSHAGAVAILTRELPSEDLQKLDGIHQGIINLITPMQAMPWKTLVRGLLKLSEKFMPVNYLLPTAASERCLKDHLKACLHDCVPPAIRFDVDWENDIGWDDVRDYALSAHSDMNAAKAGLAVKPVPGTAGLMTVGGAVQPGGGTPGLTGTHVPGGPGPQPGAPVAPMDEFVYAGKIPANQVQFNTDFGYVQKCFIDEMRRQQWSGVVRVDGEFFSVRPKDATPPSLSSGGNEQDPTRKNTVTQSFTKLGMRKSDTFGANYERMGVEVASLISNTHDSIEQYVKLNFSYLDQGGASSGQRAQFRELIRSAQTVDIMVQRVAAMGGSQRDLAEDDVFEMHMQTIALYDYGVRTGNYVGAEFISGRAAGLLPSKAAQRAADHANAAKKLQGSLFQGKGKGKGKGGKDPSEQICYYCKQPGHIAKDCPEKQSDVAAGRVKPGAKSKPGAARVRARIAFKAEGAEEE